MNTTEYKDLLQTLFGKTIAIIYIFEGEDALGYEHYETWKTDVISSSTPYLIARRGPRPRLPPSCGYVQA